MLDLNLSFVHEDERTTFRGELEESGTSNSSIVNAEGCNSSNAGDGDGDGDGDEDSSSAAGDGDMLHCFNFGILNVGDTGAKSSNSNDEDRTSQTQIRSEFVTRTLFPMSHGGGRFNQGQQVNSFLLFPNNNELQKMSLVQIQQQKPTVQQNQAGKKSRRGPRSRSSQYRGVTFYRRTGRWESHIWDCGKQVYLGGFDTAHAAARAYDRAAIKFRGVDADINFNLSDYEEDMNQQIKNLSKEDFVQILRRQTNGISRGSSKYKGVTTHKFGRWEARMGQILGKKAYDNAAIKSSQRETVNNFDASTYEREAVSASHHGIDQNLDLKLGISTPSFLGKDSTRKENLEHIQLNHGSRDPKRLQGGAMNTQIIPVSTQGRADWTWQTHGQSQTPTTAASSGFPAPAATAGIHSKLPHYYYHIRAPPPP